jgi:hypoxanthine phosphoribosyltransferase
MSSKKLPFCDEVLFTEKDILARVHELSKTIARDYEGKATIESPLVLVCVLKGSFLFMADLARALSDAGVPTVAEFICASSYSGGMQSTGEVRMLLDLRMPIRGRHVLMVEDIVDTARTLDFLMKLFTTRSPASLKMVTLLDKKGTRQVPLRVDYVCFDIPNKFVVGYGLDYAERLRELREVIAFNEPAFQRYLRENRASKL